MNLREELLSEHSKLQCSKIVAWVGDDPKRFDELLNLFLNDKYRVVQRASWPLSYCVAAHPRLISKHFSKLIKNLRKHGLHPAVKRNTVRLLQNVPIPDKYAGSVMDICFNYISSPHEPVAVKAFSLTVLHNLSENYPDILPEIKLLITSRWDYETAAFKSRAKKIVER